VVYYDPYIPKFGPLREYKFVMKSVKLTPRFLKQQDAVMILTDHSHFDYGWLVKHSPLVVDTRNATKDVRANRSKITQA
jgi:UDP-N-acetyl-D-glucosamine dehydrogenase